jgi:hypothetical protein
MAGMDCAMKRYLGYHAGLHSLGWTKKQQVVALSTGIYVHQGLASIMRLVMDSGKIPLRDELKGCVEDAATSYRDMVLLSGLNEEHEEYIMMEQCTLIQGLIYGWCKMMLPTIVNDFEIVAVEEEERFKVALKGFDVIQMSRPDFVARRKSDGQLGIHDFKTASMIGDDYIEQYRESVQMAVGTLGVEARLKEPVSHYYIHVLLKGGRGHFKKAKVADPIKKQYSDFCYGMIQPAQPPIQDDTRWAFGRGVWADKSPIWETQFTQKPKDWTNVEFWVEQLPEAILREGFVLIGPYARQSHMTQQYVESMVPEELRWVRRLWTLYDAEVQYGWSSEQFQSCLNEEIPRSYNCWNYGSRCQFYSICYKEPGWEKPENNFIPREPHHTPEMEQNR